MKAVALQIGPLAIHWYSLMILSGVLSGVWLAPIHARRWGEDIDHFSNIALFGTLLGILCARVFYVAHEWGDSDSHDPIAALEVWHGGLSIRGAVIGAVTACTLRHLRTRPAQAAAVVGAPTDSALLVEAKQ